MDCFRIINIDGYRYEDLTEENKRVIDWLKYLREDFESFKDNLDAYCDMVDDGSTLSKIEFEIADKVIEGARNWMDAQIAEYQISLAESQDK